jgi:glutamyl-tRNA synthetase
MAPPENVRVRFAPSPTGYLHIGGARTALFNYLWARRHRGTFILRIEDTDHDRSTPEAVRAILDGLRFLGIDWDEGPTPDGSSEIGRHGPYFQSARLDRHRDYVRRLIDVGAAYHCFCSKERLEALRERQRDSKALIQYDRLCMSYDREAVASRIANGEQPVVRFRVPSGKTVIDDAIRGHVVVDHVDVEDMIIARADGSPVYNLAVMADDADMGVTHVIRGEDHLTNTVKQILLLQALGLAVPRYAHIPLILGPGGSKLSKRHGAVSVTEYEDQGYLPEAMINFLVRMGWSYDDKTEIFSMAELIEKFSLESVSKSGAMYDLKKLEHLGAWYMRQKPRDEAFVLARSFLLQTPGIQASDFEPGTASRARLEKIFALEQERICRFGELPERIAFYFNDPAEPDKGATKALRKADGDESLIADYASALEREFPTGWAPLDDAALADHAARFLANRGIELGKLASPVRALLSGRAATPGLFEVIALVGKDATLRRLANAPSWIARAKEKPA